MAFGAGPAVADAPPTPTNVTATGHYESAAVSFDAPAPPSGDFVTYTVTASPGGQQAVVQTNGPAPSPIWVSNLTNGTTYTFTIVATDNGESSAPSAPSNPVVPDPTVPDTTQITGASAVDGEATVSFGLDDSADGSDGGSPITGYTVTASPGGAQATGATTPITVSGLSDGTSYTFTVTANNAVGDSAPSAPSSAVTPLAVPSATTAPVINGTPDVGQTLQVSQGAWAGSPTDFSYAWYDCDPLDLSTCTPVQNAVDSDDHVVSSSDDGYVIVARVSGTNADGETGVGASSPTTTVVAGAGAPEIETAPTVSAVNGGQPVTGTLGTWSNDPTSYSFAWFICLPDLSACAVVEGPTTADTETPTTYTPVGEDAGGVIVLGVLASNAAGDSDVALSDATAVVSFPPPTISFGVPANGQTYFLGGVGYPNYTCTPGSGTQIVACQGSMTQFPTTPGQYTFTVTAEDDDGQISSQTVSYTLASQPSPSLGPLLAPRGPTPISTYVPSVTAPPALLVSGLRQSNSRWRAGGALPANSSADWALAAATNTPVGTLFSFSSTASAVVTFAFSTLESGRMVGGHCVALTHANRHKRVCQRSVRVGSLSVSGSGADSVRFDGKLSGAKLRPGSYTAVVTATLDPLVPTGSATAPVGGTDDVGTLHFTIVK